MFKKPALFKIPVFIALIILFSMAFIISCGDLFNAETEEIDLTPRPQGTPTPVPTPTPESIPTPEGMKENAGDVWFVPFEQWQKKGANFTLDIYVNTGESQKLAAYGINIDYDAAILEVNTSIGNNGVEAGSDGFVTAVNAEEEKLRTTGFDADGKGPSTEMHLLIINFKGISAGTNEIGIEVIGFADDNTEIIDDDNDITNNGFPGYVHIE